MKVMTAVVSLALALVGLGIVKSFLEAVRRGGAYQSTRLTAALLWYLTLLWPFFQPGFSRLHWFWLLPLPFFLPHIMRGIRIRYAMRSSFLGETLGIPVAPWNGVPQFWYSTVAWSLFLYLVLLRISTPPHTVPVWVLWLIAACVGYLVIHNLSFRLRVRRQEGKSLFETPALGSPGDSPVPSGEPPVGTESASRTKSDADFIGRASPVPVGGPPSGAGGPPAPPVLQTGSENGHSAGEGRRCATGFRMPREHARITGNSEQGFTIEFGGKAEWGFESFAEAKMVAAQIERGERQIQEADGDTV